MSHKWSFKANRLERSLEEPFYVVTAHNLLTVVYVFDSGIQTVIE